MHRRHSSPAAVRMLKMKTLAAVIAATFATGALANPTGPTVAAGGASFATSGNTLSIVNTPGTIINWQQFNIGQNEITKFIQQSNQSTVLNRITGQDPSQILGALQSNGRVFLINPNGILFGQNSVIDVFGLVASNLNLANADFLAGRFSFNGGGAGAVVNQGAITTPVGGSVYLIGSNVTNQGLITSPKGEVLLAAGNSVNLADTGTPNLSVTLNANGNKAINLGRITADGGRIDIYGALIEQQGVLRADSASVDEQGRIVLKATQAVNVSGEMTADNSGGIGGGVQVLGDEVTVAATARIDASGASGGGTVLIGGDQQGRNAAVQNATTTNVAAGARITADALDVGNGGKVVVWSNDKTFYDGFISARGGANGGDGGFVETSGKTLSLSGRVDTTAAKGKTGNWLLDPASYCFFVTSATECTSTGFNASNGTATSNLDALLAASNATLAATDYVAYLPAGGSYTISSSVPSDRTLTVQAPYIYFGPDSTFNSAHVALNLDASSTYGTTTRSIPNGNLTGVIDIFGRVTSNASQTIHAGGKVQVGGVTFPYPAGLNMLSGTGTQSITAAGGLFVHAGTGEGASGPFTSSVTSAGNQTISASSVSIVAGKGTGTPTTSSIGMLHYNSAYIFAYGMNQSITASGDIMLEGGSAGSNNQAYIQQWNSNGVQTFSANQLQIRAGMSGSGNHAGIYQRDDNGASAVSAGGSQNITASVIKLAGGTGGSLNGATTMAGKDQFLTLTGTNPLLNLTAGGGIQNGANIRADNPAGTQKITINGSGTVQLTGGSGSGQGTNNASDLTVLGWTAPANLTSDQAFIRSFGSGGQELNFVNGGNLVITGGTNGAGNAAGLRATAGPQKIWSSTGADPAITLTGGTSGTYNAVVIYDGSLSTATALVQTINAKSITIKAGGSSSSDYFDQATIGLFASGGDQHITISGGGTLSLAGGAGSGTIVPPASDFMGSNPSFLGWGCATASCPQSNNNALIGSTSAQTLNFANGGTLNLTGGSFGVANVAAIVAGTSQTVTSSGGPASYPTVNIKGGAGGQLNLAQIAAGWADAKGMAYDQTIDARNLTLAGGGSGSSDYGDMATIWTTINSLGKQKVTISGGGNLTMTAGSGSGSSAAISSHPGCTASNPCPVSRNSAELYNSGSATQTIDFLSGGSLSMTGGSDGSYNRAHIWSNGPQTITSSNGAANYPNIALTGGAGGYANSSDADFFNSAEISPSDLNRAPLTIYAANITLNGGGTSSRHGAAGIDAEGPLTITTTGAVTLNGGNGGMPALKNPINIEDDRFGSSALIGSETNLTLKVGTDLTIQAASGSSAPAFIGSFGNMSLSVGGKTSISASTSPVFVGVAPSRSVTAPTGLAGIAPPSTSPFQTGSLHMKGATVSIDGPIRASGSVELNGDAVIVNAPIKAGSYFASVAGTFDLASAITAEGGSYNDYFQAPASSSGKYLQAGVWAAKGFANHGGTIQTPNGYWVVVLDPGVTGAQNAIGIGTLTKPELLAAGYHWASSAAEADTSSGTYHFYVPQAAPASSHDEQQAIIQAVADTCATNPALCASNQQQQATAAAADATAEPGSVAKGKVTVDEKLKDGKKAEDKKVAEEKKQPEDKNQAEQTAAVAKQKQEAKAADERKSPAELKQEARQAQAEAKKVDAEAKQAQAEAKKVEAEAKQAANTAKKADAEGKKAEGEAKKAEVEIKTAKTPERKAVAEAKKAEAESKLAEVEGKKIEAESKQVQATSKKVEAEAKQATHDAKQAEAEHKLALAEAKEAKNPDAKAAALNKAAEKQVEATRKKAEGEVKQSQAEEHKAAAAQKKVAAEAKQAEHDAKHAEAGAKKAEADAARAKQAGKPDEEKKALAQKADQEKKAEADHKHAQAKHAEASAKKAEHDKMAGERRSQVAKAFAKAVIAAMMPERQAQMAALRHEFKTELLKPALNILEHNPKAADLPPCGAGGGDVCVPAKAAAQQAVAVAAIAPKPIRSFVPQIERKVAVLVGINNYADKSIPSLESAVPDVEAIGKVMAEKLGYEVRIVRDATKADIVKAINGVGKEVGPNDSVAIYYAGHGYLSEKTKTGYWIPGDSSVSDPSKWISNDDIARLLQQVPAKQVTLVSDSCYSGSLTREAKIGAGAGKVDDILGKRSVTVMSSGGEEPVSDEGKDGHSIFAWSLMDSLKKVDGYEHGTAVFDNVKRSVVEAFPQVPQYGAATSAGHAAGGDYLFEVRSYK